MLKLGNHWTKSESRNHFKILRDDQSLGRYKIALQSKSVNSRYPLSLFKTPIFLPVVIDMVYGGNIKVGSKIYFPGKVQKVKKLFATDVLHAPFYETPTIGIVTTACYSLRRGFSSALGLISGDAIQVFLQEGQLAQENAFLVAVENETNAKYYVGKFNILQINY